MPERGNFCKRQQKSPPSRSSDVVIKASERDPRVLLPQLSGKCSYSVCPYLYLPTPCEPGNNCHHSCLPGNSQEGDSRHSKRKWMPLASELICLAITPYCHQYTMFSYSFEGSYKAPFYAGNIKEFIRNSRTPTLKNELPFLYVFPPCFKRSPLPHLSLR